MQVKYCPLCDGELEEVRYPANPKEFCLQSEAQMLVQMMRYEGCIPANALVLILDEPWTVAATRIEYGSDGRKVYGIHWQEPDAADLETWYSYKRSG